MAIIKISYVIDGNPELEDLELSATLYDVLGITFYEFIERTLGKVAKAIKRRCGEHLHVRCFKTGKRAQGWWFRSLSPGGTAPDIVVGFCGDVEDMEITLIHELLHLFRWDERMVEAKARMIYKSNKVFR